MKLGHARGWLESEHCVVMGVVNRTPDSFYDAGRMSLRDAVDHGLELVDQGAEILDVGGVKAGPGPEVSTGEELDRTVPLIEELARATGVPLSIETSRPSVAEAALGAGAAIVNDVTALADAALGSVCARTGAALVVMHHGGQIRGRPRHPRYADVVAAVVSWWEAAISRAASLGVDPARIVVDPGLDFGKTTYHSLELVRRIDELVAFGSPVLIAPSRKDLVGETLGLPPVDRLEGTLAVACLCVRAGVAIIRTHDVLATARAVEMVEAIMGRRRPKAAVRGLWD